MFIYYAKLLLVAAIHPGHLQTLTSLVDVYNVYDNLPVHCAPRPKLSRPEGGQDIWAKCVGALYNKYKQDGQGTYNVTFRRVRVTIFTVEEQ
jgi:hypothetical protein